MFVILTLTYDLTLSPSFFGSKLHLLVERRLIETVEGKPHGEMGNVVLVLKIHDDWKGTGVVDDLSSSVRYRIKYDALVFRLFPNEVCDVIVSNAGNYGLHCQCGPCTVYIASTMIEGFSYNNERNSYVMKDELNEIRIGSHLRVKLINAKHEEEGKNSAVATINTRDRLGLLLLE